MLGYPPSRHPREQTPPTWEQTPPWEQTPTRSRHPPGADTPPAQCMLGDTVKKRAVGILLECSIVGNIFLWIMAKILGMDNITNQTPRAVQMIYAESLIPESTINSVILPTVACWSNWPLCITASSDSGPIAVWHYEVLFQLKPNCEFSIGIEIITMGNCNSNVTIVMGDCEVPITGRNEVVTKAMFLHVSVILFTGGVSRQGEPPWTGRTPPDQADHPPPRVGRNPPGPGRPHHSPPPRQGRLPLGRGEPPQTRQKSPPGK